MHRIEKIKIVSIVVKEGDNKKGHWKNFIFTGDDGTKVSMFEPNRAGLKPSELGIGNTINAEINLDGKYANIETYELVEQALPEPLETGQIPKTQSRGFGQEDSPEKRASIETQVAIKCVIALLAAKIITLDEPIAKQAMGWVKSKLPQGILSSPIITGTIPDTLQSKSIPLEAEINVIYPAEVNVIYPREFKNVGELLEECGKIRTDDFPRGVSKTVALNIWGIKDWRTELPKLKLADAWQMILDVLTK